MAKRWIWVSTGKAGWPKLWDMTTDAVLCPTPGNLSSASKDSGTIPLCSLIKIWLSPWMAFDFAGDKPQGLMISLISSTVNNTMSWGVSALAKSSGVILLTLSSVHWAESRTAINSVKASLCSRGMGVSGYNFSRVSSINCTFCFLFIWNCVGFNYWRFPNKLSWKILKKYFR